jgi:hypothetical protein
MSRPFDSRTFPVTTPLLRHSLLGRQMSQSEAEVFTSATEFETLSLISAMPHVAHTAASERSILRGTMSEENG